MSVHILIKHKMQSWLFLSSPSSTPNSLPSHPWSSPSKLRPRRFQSTSWRSCGTSGHRTGQLRRTRSDRSSVWSIGSGAGLDQSWMTWQQMVWLCILMFNKKAKMMAIFRTSSFLDYQAASIKLVQAEWVANTLPACLKVVVGLLDCCSDSRAWGPEPML